MAKKDRRYEIIEDLTGIELLQHDENENIEAICEAF